MNPFRFLFIEGENVYHSDAFYKFKIHPAVHEIFVFETKLIFEFLK